jgi:hypothetical protein
MADERDLRAIAFALNNLNSDFRAWSANSGKYEHQIDRAASEYHRGAKEAFDRCYTELGRVLTNLGIKR